MKTITVKVKPRARTSTLERAEDGTFVARLKSPPVDGRANHELIDLVAQWFGCRRSSVEIKTGTSSRTKLVIVRDHAE
jgi:uncharacterized protein (TIGR00251 family)